MRTAKLVLSVAVVGLLGLLWQTQRETNHRLDALAAAVAARPADPPAPPPEVVADPGVVPAAGQVPRALNHVSLPPYVIEAPDILMVDVQVRDPKTGGTKPVPEQPITGQFLVRPDGTINLGRWGTVSVTGLTVEKAAAAVRAVAAAQLGGAEPVVAVDVVASNSKVYYVVTGGDGGESVYRLPCTGSDTVLDAVAQAGGHVSVAGKALWVARQTAGQPPQILPVDWTGIARHGNTQTNYQLLPGDRLYVKAGR